MATGNVSAQNNVTTAAEYQAAADEITAIINAQRADRAPIEAEQTLLQNRAELLFERQQQALNTLRAAEADPSDTAFLEQSRLAYNRATSEVNTVNTAIQQNRSVLAQSRQSTAELQDQRSTLEVLAEFAEQGPPNQNSLPPPATTVPDQTATFVPTPPGPIPPTVTPASQPAAATPTATTSAQNNVTTAAEYQAAADEITAIINTQRAELLIPLEAEQELLRNRQELLITRQQSALNTLRAAEANPSDTAFLEASRTAYARATGEVNATNLAIQQNRSVLAQSRQSTAELQEQRGRLETNADLAAQGVPPLNSLPPPATVVPDQAATTVAPPPPAIVPVFAATTADGTAGEAEAQAALQAQAPAQNNVSTAEQWEETTFEISTAQRTIRAENFATAENLANLNQQLTQASQARQLARDNLDRAVAAGASDAEIAALDAQRQTALDTAVQLEQQIQREQSVIAGNQQTLNLLEQQRFIADEAALAARSGPPGLNSVPPPATVIPDQDPAAYDLPPQTYSQNFQADSVSADGDEALAAYDQALLAQQEGRAFAQPEISASGDEALQAYEEALLAQQEGRAFESRAPAVAADGDEALAAFEQAQLAQNEAAAFGATNVNDPYYGLTPQQIAALGSADPTDPYIRARLGIPQLPGSELVATPGFGTIKTGVPLIDNALSFLGGLFGRPAAPPTPAAAEVTAASDAELQAIQDAEAQQLAEQEGRAFPPVENAPDISASGDEALQAIEDAEAAALGLQEGSAFAEPLPVDAGSDEELQAIQDAQAADLAAQEGVAFAEPVTLDDPEARAIQDALDADLAAQEGLAFPPIDSPAPVAGDEALQAIEDAETADLARQEGIAFAEPLDVPVAGDEALQAFEDAELAAQEGSAFAERPLPVSGDEALEAANEAELAALREAEGRAVFGPALVDGDPAYGGASDAEAAAINQAQADDAESFGAAARQAAQEAQLREQFTLQQRFNSSTQGDWRVRLRLAPGATYLYKAPEGQRGILQPLVATDGVIFPYTPTIQTQYVAKYDSYNLTHSNYRGYFYQNSSVGDIQITGTFTAQDTAEAEYLLAVIHFFRSVTKMFYGKDKFRGAPPPVVELSGFGEYQFNNHACLVSTFNYTLPKDVDYIQIIPNNQGLNLSPRQPKVSSSPFSTVESVQRRLSTSGLPQGAVASPADLGVVANRVNGIGQTTYVPTKIEIAIVLHPLQTRQQVSQVFSLENFANGNLLKGGFW